MAEIQFLDPAIDDLTDLDGSMLLPVLKKIAMLEENPEAGRPLGSRRGGDLTTFRKLVVGNRDLRVVYRVDPDGQICVIWVIASRTDEQCYDTALRRLEALGNDPRASTLAEVVSNLRPSAMKRLPGHS